MSGNCGTYQNQIASIMDVLAKAAVAEISKVVEDAIVVLRLETCQRQNEIEALKRNLEVVSNELRATRRALVRECINGRSIDYQKGNQPDINRGCGRKGVGVEESRCVEEECQGEGQAKKKDATIRVKAEREEEHENQRIHDGTAGGPMENGKLLATDEERGRRWSTNEDDDAHVRTTDNPTPPQSLPVSISTETPTPPQRPRLRRWWPHKLPTLLHSNTHLTSRSSTHADTHTHTHPSSAPSSEKCFGVLRGGFPSAGLRVFQGGLWGHYKSRGGQRSQRSLQQVWGRGRRRFPCGFCEKSFDRLSHLDRHRRIHTGERPYGCHMCGRRFTQKSSLKGHLRTHREFSMDVSDSTPATEHRLSEEDWDSQYTSPVENSTHLPTHSEDNTHATPTRDSHMLFTHGHEPDTCLTKTAGDETHSQASQHINMRGQLGGKSEKQRVTPMEPEMLLTHCEDRNTHHLDHPNDLNVNDLLDDDVNLHCLTQTQHLTHTQDSTSPLTHTYLTHPQESTSVLTHTQEPVEFGELQLELKAEQEGEQVDQNLHQEPCENGTGDQGQIESGVSELEFGAVEQSDPKLWANRGLESHCANYKGGESVSHSNMQLGVTQPSWHHPLSPTHIKEEEEVCPLLEPLANPETCGAAHTTVRQEVTPVVHGHSFGVRVAGGLEESSGHGQSLAHQLDTAITTRETSPSLPLATEQLALSLLSPQRDKRRFPCVQCGKSFDRLSHLERHQRIHTGERPYGCSICGRCFTQKSSLKGHQRTHTGERPYPCPRCPLAFATSSARNRHQCTPQRSRLAYTWRTLPPKT